MSVTSPAGFSATGASVGIKASGVPDAALIVAATPAVAAAVFTQNKVPAAPVQMSRAHLAEAGSRVRAVLLTSGNANAATGAEGLSACAALCGEVAESIGCDPSEVLICQTGLIGIPFPLESARAGVASLAETLGEDEASAHRAATAIMTTDTFAKEVRIERDGVTLGGMAKGAAMLAPDMATMLCLLTIDAKKPPHERQPRQAGQTIALGRSFARQKSAHDERLTRPDVEFGRCLPDLERGPPRHGDRLIDRTDLDLNLGSDGPGTIRVRCDIERHAILFEGRCRLSILVDRCVRDLAAGQKRRCGSAARQQLRLRQDNCLAGLGHCRQPCGK